MASKQTYFKLLDGTSIPWLGWGNGTGTAKTTAIESGKTALDAGIRHIDTAQIYQTEDATGEVVAQAKIPREDIYVTSKIWKLPESDPVTHDSVLAAVEKSLKKLGFVPDLYLIHNPYIAPGGAENLKKLWKAFEQLKDEGKLKSIGVSNFRPQDFETILKDAKHKPVVNQLEYHPYLLAHLEPLLKLQAEHGIVTESYGPLTPILRHPGGPLKPVLEKIAERLSKDTGKSVDLATVLLLWTKAQGVVAVTASGNAGRIKQLAEIAHLPDGLLKQEEIDEITKVGKTIHFRHYTEHMENDFPVPDLPDGK